MQRIADADVIVQCSYAAQCIADIMVQWSYAAQRTADDMVQCNFMKSCALFILNLRFADVMGQSDLAQSCAVATLERYNLIIR